MIHRKYGSKIENITNNQQIQNDILYMSHSNGDALNIAI